MRVDGSQCEVESAAGNSMQAPALRRDTGWRRDSLIGAALLPVLIITTSGALAAPQIRISEKSQVPACITPERLMAFIATRNRAPEPRFRRIAWDYKRHGEAWKVRWDFAFFQMVVETNFLLFRRGNGEPGDVRPKQNNFAGLGTTGGGVPGDAYKDVSTGVLAQIQHLVVYSGERVDNPAGHRTRLTQNDIISKSARIARRRPVTFQDLSGRWAVDRSYGRTIATIAKRFHDLYCTGRSGEQIAARSPAAATSPAAKAVVPPPPQPARRPVRRGADGPMHSAAAGVTRGVTGGVKADGGAPPPQPATAACRIQIASYGGDKAILIRAVVEGETQLTALQVLDGFEEELSRSFIKAHAPGGQSIGRFGSSDAALKQAYQLCRQPAGN